MVDVFIKSAQNRISNYLNNWREKNQGDDGPRRIQNNFTDRGFQQQQQQSRHFLPPIQENILIPIPTPTTTTTITTLKVNNNNHSESKSDLLKRWRAKKYQDDRERRQREVQLLQKELRVRELSRHNRQVQDEEQRRIRLQLEGLVLERPVPKREEFPELSLAAKQLVQIIWDRNASHAQVFSSAFGVDITRKDLLTLSGCEWLNDEVINFFINLIVERSQEDSSLPKVYAFNTFFYQKLCQMGFAGVKRWTRKVNIFDHQLLVIPIHLGNHWCMTIVDFEHRRIDYYDSLLNDNFQCLQAIRDYLPAESMDKKKENFDLSGWELECRKDIPNQYNCHDCGMFACLFAEYASRRARITFNQKHIPYFRERMVYEIYQKKLL